MIGTKRFLFVRPSFLFVYTIISASELILFILLFEILFDTFILFLTRPEESKEEECNYYHCSYYYYHDKKLLLIAEKYSPAYNYTNTSNRGKYEKTYSNAADDVYVLFHFLKFISTSFLILF